MHSASIAVTCCCSDCYEDERFDPSVDKKTGFHTKQMLCVPIMDSSGERLGAVQVINNKSGEPFTDMDVELLQGFRGYIQISILNERNHKAAEEAAGRPQRASFRANVGSDRGS